MMRIGDMGFFDGGPRNATIRAQRNCIIHKIGFEDYYRLTQRSCLKKAPILSNLSVTELGTLLPYVKMISYEDGQYLRGVRFDTFITGYI